MDRNSSASNFSSSLTKERMIIIVLGVLVIFLIYYAFSIFYSVPISANNIYLGDTKNPVKSITTNINSPTVTNYTIGFWIYINSYSQNIGEFISFGKSSSDSIGIVSDFTNNLPSTSSNNLLTSTSKPNNVCTFSMDTAGSPTLYANISTKSLTSTYQIQSIPITNNLPIQTWTYVLVSVSTNAGNYADCYLNGKLIVSQQLKNAPWNYSVEATTNSTNVFNFTKSTSSIIDVYLNKVSWIGNSIDPQTAWSYYSKGNGNPSGLGTMSSYHLEVDFTSNGNVNTWKLF